MSGFEFTPDGIVPIGATREAQKMGAIAGASVDIIPAWTQMVIPNASSMRIDNAGLHIGADAKPLKPRDVVKLAKARLKDVNREIARLHKLERERDELKRLIDAADGRPVALVRSLPTRSA